MQEYALYKGDKFIDLGTKQYLAKLLNVSIKTIEHYMTPTYQKRCPNGNSYIVIKIENDEEDLLGGDNNE